MNNLLDRWGAWDGKHPVLSGILIISTLVILIIPIFVIEFCLCIYERTTAPVRR